MYGGYCTSYRQGYKHMLIHSVHSGYSGSTLIILSGPRWKSQPSYFLENMNTSCVVENALHSTVLVVA